MDFKANIDVLYNSLNVYKNSLDDIDNNIAKLDDTILSIKWEGVSHVSFLERYERLRSMLLIEKNKLEILTECLSNYIQDLNYVVDNSSGL